MVADPKHSDWSRTYWGILVNQVLVVGVVLLLAMGMLRESYRASEAAELYPPVLTQWYFAVQPVGLFCAGLLSIVVSGAVIGFRQRFAAIAITSMSFIVCVVFLAGGILASILPLLVAIRDRLPPEARW